MSASRSVKFFVSFAATVALGGAVGLSADYVYKQSLSETSSPATVSPAVNSSTIESEESAPLAILRIKTPSPLRAIYMTQCVAGTPSFRRELVRFIEETELNGVVIDIKDFSGGIAFPSSNPTLAPFVSTRCAAHDMEAFVRSLNEKGIYAIGRITVFQDPLYTKLHPESAVKRVSATTTPWRDNKGLSFVDVGYRPFWDYIVELSRESWRIGFDELNFDYIRYPSDGPMQDAHYIHSAGKEKAVVLEEFFAYLAERLGSSGAVLSADLFGYATIQHDDLGIGQILERALPHFDFIYPMVYPSHYNPGFAELADPNTDPYRVVYTSLVEALRREAATTTRHAGIAYKPLMREIVVPAMDGLSTTTTLIPTGLYEKPAYHGRIVPWLQSFDYPVHYSPAMVEAQIQATYDAGINSWIFWDPANRYTSLRAVLAKPPLY